MNKLVLPLILATCFTTATAFADDPLANFPSQWTGTYRTSNCTSVPSGGNATMSTVVEVYKPDQGYGSEVFFTGTINLDQWPTSTPYFASPIALKKTNSEDDSFVKVYNGYNSNTLFSADGNADFVGGIPSYDTDTKTLVSEYTYLGGCQINLILKGTN